MADSSAIELSGDEQVRNPSPGEQRAIVAAQERLKDRPLRPAMKLAVVGMEVVRLGAEHSDELGMAAAVIDAFGTSSNDFANRSMRHLMNMARERGKTLTSEDFNAALAFVSAINPQNEMEAALAVQMYATHDLSMEMMAQAKHTESARHTSEYGTLATKMARTFTGQIEALAKLRRGGEQTVRVEHVHVYEGGQAVVGVVNQGAGVSGKAGGQPYGPDIAVALGPAMLGEDAAGHGMPVPGDARPEKVPHPRRRKPGCETR